MMHFFKYLRIFIGILLITLLITSTALYPGHVQIVWMDHVIDTSISFFVITLLITMFVFANIYRLWQKLLRLPERYQHLIQKKRFKRGQDLLIDGVTALACGQHKEAQDFIALAQESAPNQPISLLVAAQTADFLGEAVKAEKIYNQMIQDPHLAFLGLRGLIIQGQAKGDWAGSLDLLEQAFNLRPDSPWVLQNFILCHLMSQRYNTAISHSQINIQKYLTKNEILQYEAALWWSKLNNLGVLCAHQELSKMLEQIHTRAPHWSVISGLLIASMGVDQKNSHQKYLSFSNRCGANLVKVAQKFYEQAPNRWIVETFLLQQHGLKKDWIDLYQDIEKITKSHPLHYETLLMLAKGALAAKLWGEARIHLDMLLEKFPTGIVYEAMAKYWQDQSISEVDYPKNWQHIHDLLHQASQVPYDFHWVCRQCAYVANKAPTTENRESPAGVYNGASFNATTFSFEKLPWGPLLFSHTFDTDTQGLLTTRELFNILDWDVVCPKCHGIETFVWQLPLRINIGYEMSESPYFSTASKSFFNIPIKKLGFKIPRNIVGDI